MTHEDILKAVNAYTDKMVIFTDKADFTDQPLKEEDLGTLLEVRAFSRDSEFRAFRSTLEEDFVCSDSTAYENDDKVFSFTRTHFLDIDTTQSKGCNVHATGGGSYQLPAAAAKAEKLKVVYYYSFDDEGIARTIDWRLAGFEGTRKEAD